MFSFFFIRYQAEVNRSMGVYRQKYEDWFNGLSEAERKAETSRMNSGKSTRARNNAAAAAAAAQGNIKRSLIMSTNIRSTLWETLVIFLLNNLYRFNRNC